MSNRKKRSDLGFEGRCPIQLGDERSASEIAEQTAQRQAQAAIDELTAEQADRFVRRVIQGAEWVAQMMADGVPETVATVAWGRLQAAKRLPTRERRWAAVQAIGQWMHEQTLQTAGVGDVWVN